MLSWKLFVFFLWNSFSLFYVANLPSSLCLMNSSSWRLLVKTGLVHSLGPTTVWVKFLFNVISFLCVSSYHRNHRGVISIYPPTPPLVVRIFLDQKLVFHFWLPISYSAYLVKELATVSCNLAWEIPWTEEPGGVTVHWITKSQTWLSD